MIPLDGWNSEVLWTSVDVVVSFLGSLEVMGIGTSDGLLLHDYVYF